MGPIGGFLVVNDVCALVPVPEKNVLVSVLVDNALGDSILINFALFLRVYHGKVRYLDLP